MMFLNLFAPFDSSMDELLVYSDKIGLFEAFGYAERERLINIRDEGARALSLGGLIALKEILDKRSLSPSLIIRESGGKPRFISADAGEFSISHSGDLSVALYGRKSKIGVDIEKISLKRDLRGIAKRFFSCSESQYLEEKEYEAESFYKIWTAKEAIAKFEGEALADILRGLDITSECKKYKLAHFHLIYGGEAYVLCVCGEDSIEMIKNFNNIEILNL